MDEAKKYPFKFMNEILEDSEGRPLRVFVQANKVSLFYHNFKATFSRYDVMVGLAKNRTRLTPKVEERIKAIIDEYSLDWNREVFKGCTYVRLPEKTEPINNQISLF